MRLSPARLSPALLAAALLAAAFGPGRPAAAGVPPEQAMQAEILPGWQAPGGTRIAALRIRLAPGWKTYWRAPGDAGVPMRASFEGSQNLRAARMHWPRPEVFESAGRRTVGYHRELVLPLTLTPADPARPVALAAALEFGICEEICVPVSVALEAALAGPGAPDPAIAAALAAEPRRLPGKAACDTTPIADGLRLSLRAEIPPLGGEEIALVEITGRPVWVSEATSGRSGGTLTAEADLVPETARPFDLPRGAVRLTVLGRDGAAQIEGCAP